MSDRIQLLSRLAAAVALQTDGRDPVTRVCAAACGLLDGDGGWITMLTDDASQLLAATDATAERLEDIQEVLGVGPGPLAMQRDALVAFYLGGPDPTWSPFAEAAARETPAVAVAAVPMHAGGRLFGVMSLYRTTPGPLARAADNAAFLADAVCAAVLEDPEAGANGSGAWSNQAEVHQATGMVVAQLSMPVDDALVILRAHAFATGTDLVGVARAVIRRELDFGQNGGS